LVFSSFNTFLFKVEKIAPNKADIKPTQKPATILKSRSFEPYSSIDDINAFFGTKKTTTGSKSKEIRDLFKLRHYDKDFSTKYMQESNPFAQMIMVDGMIMPITILPEELQAQVRQIKAAGGNISLTTIRKE
jgi:hypothetical protein